MAHLVRAQIGTTPIAELMSTLDSAIAMARRIESPRALIESLRTRLNLDRDPEHISERVHLISEMLAIADRIEDEYLQMELLIFRIFDYAALGEVEGWLQDLESLREIGNKVGEPFYDYNYQTMSVAPLVQLGDFEKAEQMAMSAFETGQQLSVDNNEGVMGVQMFSIRRLQGRLAEIAPVVQHFVNEQGEGAAWRPGLALIYAEIGELDKARVEFERLSTDRFSAIPQDSLWQTSLTYLAETCRALEAVDDAEILYELLLPYKDLAVVVGNASVCLGATARYLGQLATLVSRMDEAEDHFQRAIELESRMSSPVWLAHSQYWYSQMLLKRGRSGDIENANELLDSSAATASRLGLHGLRLQIQTADG